MTRNEAISIILSRLGERPDLETLAIAEMKLSQTSLEHGPIMPWFLLTLASGAYCTVGEGRVPVPSDFLRETEDGESSLWVVDAAGQEVEMQKVAYNDLKLRYAESEADLPARYALVGEYFRFAPVPDQAYQLKMLYYAKDAVVAADTENKWLKYAPELLIAYTGRKLAMYIQDPGLSGVFQQDVQMAYQRLTMENTARLEAGRFRQMGED